MINLKNNQQHNISILKDKICRIDYNGNIIEATLNSTALYKFNNIANSSFCSDTHLRCMDANNGTWLFLDVQYITSVIGWWGIKEFYEDFIF